MTVHELMDPALETPRVRRETLEEPPQRPAASSAAPAASPFDPDELAQFRAEDAWAGGVIARMLSMLFLYTAVVMTVVLFWTLRAVSQ